MDQLGEEYHNEGHEGYFQFGPGEPLASRKKWIYQVGVLGKTHTTAIVEVVTERPVPRLVGQTDMKKWGVVLDFPNEFTALETRRRRLCTHRRATPVLI